MNILLFTDISLSVSSEAVLVARWWDTELDSIMLTKYADTTILLQRHKVSPIGLWEGAKSMLRQWSVFLAVLLVPPKKHCSLRAHTHD